MAFLWATLFGTLLGDMAAPAEIRAEETVPLEYQVKAAFLCNFVKFVEWPEQAFASPDAPLVIGVLGENPFGDALEAAVRNQTFFRPVLVRRSRDVEALKDSHILFISRSEQASARAILDRFKGTSVLTAGDMEGFAEDGGIVTFFRKGNKIRFEINRKAAKNARLKISSRLLSLAQSARASGGGP